MTVEMEVVVVKKPSFTHLLTQLRGYQNILTL